MKKLFTIATAVLALAFISCASYRPVAAGPGKVGSKHGEATSANLLGFIPLGGDNTMLRAAQNGGIEHIATVDQKYFSLLGIYTSVTTIVTGE
ncbi:TRL domain-containing protein [uncultured Treponema sp.]|uniref:TRL domain-containing protein n=1 Tax=uncultured Treponema sp. TaxID=162155 RepID=UPI0025E83D64|nr:TRL domain-containing protein [uncultured Treponema sp.]